MNHGGGNNHAYLAYLRAWNRLLLGCLRHRDPQEQCSAGDLVRIVESKPLSKLKRWRVVSIEQKSVDI